MAKIADELGARKPGRPGPQAGNPARAAKAAPVKAAPAKVTTPEPIAPGIPAETQKPVPLKQTTDSKVHGDSPLGTLWRDLAKADRNDLANQVIDIGEDLSSTEGQKDVERPQQAIYKLEKLLENAPDFLRPRIRKAIADIDAPEKDVPDLPKSTPPEMRKLIAQLNRIPVARKTGRVVGRTVDKSAVDRLADLYRAIDEGNFGRASDIDRELGDILRSLHESTDGAYQMWRLQAPFIEGSSPEAKALRLWIRNAPRKE